MGQSNAISKNVKCEDFINRLCGVIASKIVEDEMGLVKEVHVLISEDRHPKQISKDVQTVLATKLDKPIDYRCISIAQTAISNVKGPCRINFQAVNTRKSNNGISVEVELVKNNELFIGSSEGVNSKNNSDRVTVEATLMCLRKMMISDELLLIEDVEEVRLAKSQVAMVAINKISKISEDILVGSAMIRDDRKESLVRATLDAVNRKVNYN